MKKNYDSPHHLLHTQTTKERVEAGMKILKFKIKLYTEQTMIYQGTYL